MKLFRKGSLGRNASWMFIANGSAIVIQAICFVFTARLLGVVQYGIYAGATALVSIVSQYSAWGSGILFIRYVSVDRGKFAAYWGNMLLSITLVGGGLVCMTSLLGGKISGKDTGPLLFYVATADCIGTQLTLCCSQVFIAFEKMGIASGLQIVSNCMRLLLVVGIYAGVHRITVKQWVVIQMSLALAGALVSVYIVLRKCGLPKWEPGLFRARAVEGLTFAFSGSTTSAYNDIDKTMLSHFGMNRENGTYSLAYRVINIATLPVSSIHAAAFPRFCRIGAQGPADTMAYALKILRRTVPLGMAASVGLWLAAPILPILAGKGFAESVTTVRWICLLPLFRAFHICAGDAMSGSGFQRYRLGGQCFAAGGNFLLNLWLIPRYGWLGAAWSSLATDAALGAMNWGTLSILALKSRNRDPVAMRAL
jgi:O-antigen/teichoic acid export membrane protein